MGGSLPHYPASQLKTEPPLYGADIQIQYEYDGPPYCIVFDRAAIAAARKLPRHRFTEPAPLRIEDGSAN